MTITMYAESREASSGSECFNKLNKHPTQTKHTHDPGTQTMTTWGETKGSDILRAGNQ